MHTIAHLHSAQRQPLLPLNTPPLQTLSRQTRNAPATAPAEPAQSAREKGDHTLAMAYHSALLQAARQETPVTISPIPPDSTFGQWWEQLRHAFKSPEVRQWIKEKGINTQSFKLNPASGSLSFTLQHHLDPTQKRHTIGQDDPHWAAISAPVLQAGQVIAAGNADMTFTPPATDLDEPVPYEVVGGFYTEPRGLRGPALHQQAAQIDRNQGFTKLDPNTSAGLIKARSEGELQNQRAAVGDIYNRYNASASLRHLASAVKTDSEDVGHIKDELKRTRIDLDVDSTYQPDNTGQSGTVSLLQLLEDHGWDIPSTDEQLLNLATALSTAQPKAPAHGNLGGALSWPVPLDPGSQEQLRQDLRTGKVGDIALGPFDSVLAYLLNNRPLTPEEQRNPRPLIDSLLKSPRGEALGQALQATFEARAIKGSAADWLLAALSVGSNKNEAGDRANIEGYQLFSSDNQGKSASTVLQEVTDHLTVPGKTPAPVASVHAHLMLASRAPEFLVKGVPEQVVIGTHSWVSFATAVARIEAKAPGATAAMSYAHVMLEGSIAPITDDERRIEYAAQNQAIKHWAVANGMAPPTTDAAMTAVRKAFDAQISELREAAETQIGDLPSAKAMALEQLKKALPDMDPALFEKKCITSTPSSRHFPGPYSILDLYRDGRGLRAAPDSSDEWKETTNQFFNAITAGLIPTKTAGAPAAWVSSEAAIKIDDVLATLQTLPGPQEPFDKAFTDYSNAVTKTTSAQIKHLISKLPLEDRKNLEFGEITIRKESDYYKEDRVRRVAPGALLVETKRGGNVMTYEIDRSKGTITQRPGQTYDETRPSGGFSPAPGKLYDVIKPTGQYAAGITDEHQGAQGTPDSFGSARTRYIVDAVIKDMDLPEVKKYAQGATTFDTEVPTYKKIEEFVLNLIPLRSAITKFIAGDVPGGIADLAFDIFGFAVGLGAAAKGAKALSAGASALAKVGHGVKILGRAAVGALNPLSGIDDLVRQGGIAAYKGVKQLRGSYRSVNLLELAKRPDIAEGTFKALNSPKRNGILAKFDEATQRWYAFNPRTQQAFGKALEDFSVAPLQSTDLNRLPPLGSDDVTRAASQQHGLAASGTFTAGQEIVEGNAVLFQGNWHQYDAVKKRAFGPPLKDFKPSRVAASGEIRPVDADLVGYESRHVAPDELSTKGLQGNVYVGRSKKEYVKVDGILYESQVKDGQRIIRHPARAAPDIPVRDLGAAGWEPTSRSARLPGGAGNAPTPWKLGDTTYVVPMDDIKTASHAKSPFALNYKGVDQSVTFDSSVGAWKATNLSTGVEGSSHTYFWRSGKGKWQQGTLKELKQAKQADAHRFQFVDVPAAASVSLPKDLKPIPTELHYFWAGQDIPPHLVENMAHNAVKASGYKSILHVDADNPAVFQKIKSDLARKAPGLNVANLNDDEVFKQFKNSDMYSFFRKGQGQNLAAASDVARYPIMDKYGGAYLDTDDIIQADVGSDILQAGSNDILLNRPILHKLTGYRPFYNTSSFATQPGNPLLKEMSAQMHKKFADNKAYFAANRPKAARGADGQIQYTPEFEAYERKIFETVGPNLFNDVLKSKRPDMYDLGFDKLAKKYEFVGKKFVPSGPLTDVNADLRQYYESKGITPPALLGLNVQKAKKHYIPLFHQFNVKIGAEHSWLTA
ncbi:glycosyltransferase [Pseudomonas sp. ICMP 8385]|uniref:glycosyltransferase n=1 Tax=Pseudomonas sp. ICMP 8385 TaxID=1718920 RepID=UPI000C07C6B1|nr:glycosyltransferase [Pseudomonas sp. ICMP 8385]